MAVGLEKSGRWVLWVPLVAVVLVLGVLAGTHPALADTAYTVNTAADAVDATIGDGLCLTAAGKCSLRAAIQEANANPDLTVITLKEKTHKITILGADEDAGATGDFDLSSPITIQGVTAATSIVDANFIDRAFDLHADAALTLMNATVRNGFTAGQGGAIAAEVAGTSVTATNVVFQGNNSQGAGGAASAVNGGTLVIQRSTFVDNLAPQGGALYFYDSGDSAIFDSLFDDNSAEYGGAITTYLSTLVIEDTRFEDNLAECYTLLGCDPLLMEGGAIYAGTYDPGFGGTITLNRVGFHRNASTGWAGGFSLYNAVLNIDASSFDSNTAVQGAGAGYTFGTDGSITSSAFTNNSATGANAVGGAVYFQDSAFTVSVSTFSGNSAFSGGGVYVSGDAPPRARVNDTSFQHVTIANNTATDGGGLWLVTGGGGLTLTASIIDGNTASSLGPDCGGATITISWTLISNDTDCALTGTNNILDQSAGLAGLSYGINGTTLGHVPMMASPVLVAETACTILFDQHDNLMPLGAPCTLGAVSGLDRNLLTNGSFESGISGWTVVSPDGKDKTVSTTPYAGTRAFVFKGVPGKTSAIRQVVNGAVLTAIQSGDTLCASAMVYTKSPVGRSLSVRITVKYSDGTKDKSSQPVALIGGDYTLACSGTVTVDLTGGRTINKVEAKVTSTSTAGKAFVDNVSATLYVGSGRAPEATRAGAAPLPLPAIPEGFRR